MLVFQRCTGFAYLHNTLRLGYDLVSVHGYGKSIGIFSGLYFNKLPVDDDDAVVWSSEKPLDGGWFVNGVEAVFPVIYLAAILEA